MGMHFPNEAACAKKGNAPNQVWLLLTWQLAKERCPICHWLRAMGCTLIE